jgi:palmitoyltransferase
MALLSSRPRFPALRSLAVPSVCVLICFLAYSSQYLFYHLDPGPLTTSESIWFNILVAAVWLSYERACRVDPGRLPRNLAEAGEAERYDDELGRPENPAGDKQARVEHSRRSGRWCKRCEAAKPPRAHHCRQCGRYIFLSSSLQLSPNRKHIGASPRWITIALGPRTVSPTQLSPTSSVLSSIPPYL